MGGCTSDIYTQVKKAYGRDFQNFIVLTESLKVFQKEVQTSIQKQKIKMQNRKNGLLKDIKEKQQFINEDFGRIKISFEEKLAFSQQLFGQMKNVSVQDMYKIKKIRKKIQQFKDFVNMHYQTNKNSFIKNMQMMVQKLRKKQKQAKQKLIMFDDFPQETKIKLHQLGIKQFGIQIKSKLKQYRIKHQQEAQKDSRFENSYQAAEQKILNKVISDWKNYSKIETNNILEFQIDAKTIQT